MTSSPWQKDDDSGSGTCAPHFPRVRPLVYQFFGSDPELRKWVHRCLTHFCHGLNYPKCHGLLGVDDLANATAQISDNRYAAFVFHTDGANDAQKTGGMVH